LTDIRFRHFEVVRARANPEGLSFDVAGAEGVVLGISADEESAEPWYAIAFGDHDTVMLPEHLLAATGRHSERSAFYDGDAVRVSREGRVVADDDRPPA
jgi:hypothetical protein